MSAQINRFPGGLLDPAHRILKAAIHSWNQPSEQSVRQIPARTFVTVSRQPGAGAITFSHRLAERLNKDGEDDWSAWDSELVEKVSTEHGIAREIIEMIPNRRMTWLDELLQNIASGEHSPNEVERRAYKRVAMTIRALASAGHAIIVGQGGAFITEGMPGAIHLRLVAPLEHRIKYTAARENILLHEAAAQIVQIDRRRDEFYRRYWPTKTVGPETFTLTLNSAELSLGEMVECVSCLIRNHENPATLSGNRVGGRKEGRSGADRAEV